MGRIERDDGWRTPDWLWQKIEPLAHAGLAVAEDRAAAARLRRRVRWAVTVRASPTAGCWTPSCWCCAAACRGTPCAPPGSATRAAPIAALEEWERAGVFHEIWRRGLRDDDAAVGLEWASLAADGALAKAPLGGPGTGPNPTDRATRGRNVRFSARRGECRSGGPATAPSATTTHCCSWRAA
jgi:putative transposase